MLTYMDHIEGEGRAKGGFKRAEVLSPEERSAIARKGAVTRWGLQATHKGNFKEDFGIDVECYVLDDERKTAVISQSGMGLALGLSPRGNAFPRFLTSKGMLETVSAQLAEKLAKPVKFQWAGVGAQGQPNVIVHGFDVTLLIDVCKAIIQADDAGRLHIQQKHVAEQAHVIINASAKVGIQNLVYKLAGYDATKEEVVAAFKLYVQEEAKKYEQEFPNELYMQWHRLYQIPVPVRGKPWQFKHLTANHVYFPLAKSNGKILELIRALKAKDGDRQKKLFQFLNELGARALRIQIGRILEMSESSKSKVEYENKIMERFGGQLELDFGAPASAAA